MLGNRPGINDCQNSSNPANINAPIIKINETDPKLLYAKNPKILYSAMCKSLSGDRTTRLGKDFPGILDAVKIAIANNPKPIR